MDKFERAESEYNRQYDPYGLACEKCQAQDPDLCICEVDDDE